MDSNIVLATQEYNVVGTRPIRHDGTDKGHWAGPVRRRYKPAGTPLREGPAEPLLPRAHQVHRRQPGVGPPGGPCRGNLRRTFPNPWASPRTWPRGRCRTPCSPATTPWPRTRRLYKGHAIAAVAATSPHAAEEALSLIDVEYEVLPPVMDAVEALKDDAPVLHERLATIASFSTRAGGLRKEDDQGKSSNLANRFTVEIGDLAQGFNDADIVVEREFKTEAVHQGYIEPHSATAHWGADDRNHHLVQLPGPLRRPGHGGQRPGHPRVQYTRDSHGDRGRVRRQADLLPGARGRRALQEDRSSREADHEPDRGIRGHGPDHREGTSGSRWGSRRTAA